MAKAHDHTGKRFGRLTVLKRTENRNRLVCWRCICDCGATTDVLAVNLRTGNTRSCGCLGVENRIKHGKSSTRLYKVWSSMKSRCANPTDKSYRLYGGRGIRVCNEWRGSYEAFESWAKNTGYKRGLTIERVDVDGDYSPENCMWISKAAQSMNTRRCVLLTYRGETKPIKAWADDLGIPYARLQGRIYRGWGVEEAFTAPPHMKRTTAATYAAEREGIPA